MPDPSATLALHLRCPACGGTGSVAHAGRFHCRACRASYGEAERVASRPGCLPCGHVHLHQVEGDWCATCDGRGEWDETITLGELAQWVAERLPASQEGEGLPLGQALAQEAVLRKMVQAEVKRIVRPPATTGKKGGR